MPLLIIAVGFAVAQDWLGAPHLLRAATDAWFGLWAWIGEQFAASYQESVERLGPPTSPASVPILKPAS